MQQQILKLAKSLIAIESTKERPEELEEVMNLAKSQLKGAKFEEFSQNGSKSLLASNQTKSTKKFKVILNAHLDVVQAKQNQFKPVEKNNRLYGRGAYDMKAAAAVEILLFDELKDKVNYPLALQLVTDEETGGYNGTKYQVEQGIKSEIVIVGETTNSEIRHKSKEVHWIEITTTGKSAHAAYLWDGENAANKMITLLTKLQEKLPLLKSKAWASTLNISSINVNNKAHNSVPDNCKAVIDIRTIPENAEETLKVIENTLEGKAEYKYLIQEGCYYTKPDSEVLKKLQKSFKDVTGEVAFTGAADGGCDLRHYPKGTHAFEFGPKGSGHHSADEWVDIRSLCEYYQVLKDFLLKI